MFCLDPGTSGSSDWRGQGRSYERMPLLEYKRNAIGGLVAILEIWSGQLVQLPPGRNLGPTRIAQGCSH